MKRKTIVCIFLAVILTAFLSASAFALDEWGMFRRDKQRTGATDQTVNPLGLLLPNRLRPIWIYPVPATVNAPIDNDYGTTDIAGFDATPRGTSSGQWIDNDSVAKGTGAYNDNYLYIRTQYSSDEQWEKWYTGTTVNPYARWTLDRTAITTAANFYIYVWFPSTSSAESPFIQTLDAHYVVEDVLFDTSGTEVSRTVLGRFTLDQTSGEAWVNLGADPFEVPAGGLHKLEVTLTNETQNQSNATPQRIAIADAVKFVQDTGSVVSSPVVSQISSTNPYLLSSPIYTKPLPVVANQDTSRDVGVVNAINTENDITTALDDRGTLAWHFPKNLDNWIANGITSTPAVATIGGEELAIVPAGDGQVYAIRTASDAALTLAGTTRFVWQGPGYTLGDPTSKDATSWTEVNTQPGYQGDSYWRATAAANATGSAVAEWTQTVASAGQYAISVWIPPSTTAYPLFSNVKYIIKISGNSTVYTVNISQRNGGQWIRLGTYSITAGATVNVTLDNVTAPSSATPIQYVAADALKIVPSDLAAFEFSSPVIDDTGADAGDIYVAGSNGRVYKLRVGQTDPVWVYPDPNQSPAITDPTNAKYPAPNSVGGFYASPTLSADQSTLYIGSSDGIVYAINTADGTRKWRYPAYDSTNTTQSLGEISSTAVVGNYIYVAIGGESTGYTYDASGRVVALTDNGTSATASWWYPSSPSTSGDNKGAFMYSSPLVMPRFGETDPSLFIGSTDGYFYGLNAADGTALANQFDNALAWAPTDLLNMTLSSPAGTVIQPGYTRNGGIVTINPLPYAFIGSDNMNVYGIDLRDGFKDWFWNLYGYVSASPAVAKERMYAADEAGFTWGFTSKPGGAAGGEDWNTDIGIPEAPTGGSETGATDQGKTEIDIYSKASWDTWETTVAGKKNPHDFALTDPVDPYEWGEKIYFVVWGINSPTSSIKVSLKSRGGGRQATSGSESVTIPLTEIKQTNMLDTDGSIITVYYAKYVYDLDGSNALRTQTPGQKVTISATEIGTVSGRDQTLGDVFAPDSKTGMLGVKANYQPRYISINNPLGFVYNDTHGEQTNVAVTAAYTTTRTDPSASLNGNFFNPVTRAFNIGPFVRPNDGTAHGTVSNAREVVIADRSLMGAAKKQLNKFRVDFSDLSWLGIFPSTLLPWETPPVMGPWNKSSDYPNILQERGIAKMSATGINPSKISVGLAGTTIATPTTPPSTWSVGRNGVLFSVNVPKYQPANAPADMSTAATAALRGSGYSGLVRVYIDSNNNGKFDSAFGLGAANFRRRNTTGNNLTEAYREFLLQVHVLPDMRAEVAEKTIDIGQVPHGFGLVRDSATSQSVSFYDNLADNLAIWDPAGSKWGFKDWFKTFTVYNQGNVNLLNLKVYQPYMVSDTVSDLYRFNGNDPQAAIASGDRIPYSHTVTSIDPLFMDDGPGVSPVMGLTARTFHKPRVGEDESVLMIPDSPENLYSTNFSRTYFTDPVEGQEQKLPQLSISVPIAQPVGIYYGKFTLYNDINNNGKYEPDLGESIGDPTINLTMSVAEDRLTDGSMKGTIPHIDKDTVSGVGDMSPAGYRDPSTGNVQVIWTSPRYGMENTVANPARTATPVTTDPWYLYISTLPWDDTNGKWTFAVDKALPDTSWWLPTGIPGATGVSTPFPPISYLAADDPNSFFPEPVTSQPNLGAPGTTRTDTVKFTSPSITVDAITKRVWAFFTGQAYKSGSQTPENRSYVSEITGGKLLPDNVYDTDRPTPNSNRNIDGNWTTPKYGFKGLPTHMQRVDTDNTKNLFLWTFWFGGNNGKWRIFYNANTDPDGIDKTPGKDNWTTNAQLPMPNGLISMAEPSPYYKESAYWDTTSNGQFKDILDVVYSGYSSLYKNSDIYLSRYQPNTTPDKRNGAIQMYGSSAWRLPQRDAEYFLDDTNSAWYPVTNNDAKYVAFTKLNRSTTGATWSSTDTDWDPLAGFRVMIFTDTSKGELADWKWYELTTKDGVRDSKTGAYLYSFTNDSTLRQLFRSIVVDPATGTVKFLRAPGKYAQVVASYTPRAYRLTTDTANDDSPFAIMDTDTNPVYKVGNPADNPFILSSKWDPDTRPSTDRLWVFWRRPGINKQGVGIHYQTYRYGIRLATQIAINSTSGKPQLISVTPIDVADGGWELTTPVEIDWAKNNIYFCSREEGNKVKVSYIDKNGDTVNMLATVELIEELGASKEGSLFGNLTQLMVNEGQISAFKDRVQDQSTGNITEDRVWAFWTSARSGNTDIYYETISPRFYGVKF